MQRSNFPSRPIGRLALAALAALPFGCSSPTQSTGTPADSGVPASSAIEVKSSRQIPDAIGFHAPSGDLFVAVDLILHNQTEAAIPLIPMLFSVTTTDGLQHVAAAESLTYPGGCDATAMLAVGRQYECTVLFALSATATTTMISYMVPGLNPKTFSAPLTTTSCLCNRQCVDFQTDPMNCGGCGMAVPTGGACTKGVPTCPMETTLCGQVCADLTSNLDNCGGCGKACPHGTGQCNNGSCYYQVQTMTIESCKTACVDSGGTCDPNGTVLTIPHPALVHYDASCLNIDFYLPTCTDLPPAVNQGAGGCTGNFQIMWCACKL